MEKKIFVNTQMDVWLEEELRKIAYELHISRSEVVRKAIKEFVESHKVIKVKEN